MILDNGKRDKQDFHLEKKTEVSKDNGASGSNFNS